MMGDIDIEKGIFMLTRVFYMCLAIILSISSKLTRRFVRYISVQRGCLCTPYRLIYISIYETIKASQKEGNIE